MSQSTNKSRSRSRTTRNISLSQLKRTSIKACSTFLHQYDDCAQRVIQEMIQSLLAKPIHTISALQDFIHEHVDAMPEKMKACSQKQSLLSCVTQLDKQVSRNAMVYQLNDIQDQMETKYMNDGLYRFYSIIDVTLQAMSNVTQKQHDVRVLNVPISSSRHSTRPLLDTYLDICKTFFDSPIKGLQELIVLLETFTPSDLLAPAFALAKEQLYRMIDMDRSQKSLTQIGGASPFVKRFVRCYFNNFFNWENICTIMISLLLSIITLGMSHVAITFWAVLEKVRQYLLGVRAVVSSFNAAMQEGNTTTTTPTEYNQSIFVTRYSRLR